MSGLTVGPRPPRPAPRRVQLGADAWSLLAQVTLAEAALQPPFRIEDGPPLDDVRRAATEDALRASGLAPGDSDDLLEDLHPSLRESLRCHAEPLVLVDTAVGLGERLWLARHAMRGELVCGVAREQRPSGEDALELGPVELTTMLVDDLATEVLRGFGDLAGEPDREPLVMDAAVSLAAVRALAEEHLDLAKAVLGTPAVPPPLRSLAAGLRAVAQVGVGGASGVRVLVALQLDDGWWRAGLDDENVVLQPVDEDDLVTDLAGALALAMRSAQRTHEAPP